MPTFKVGILHSLSGTMAKREKPLVDASLLAIDEINSTGGILGNRIEPVIEDGASNSAIFTNKANKLIQQDKITTIFGCWTSFARKSIKPAIEKSNSLLWYPVQYEGLESSKNIIYTGGCLNQQIHPAIRWLIKNQKKRFFLLGSDYVFARIANKFIKIELKQENCQVLAEEYKPLGANDFADIISQIKEVQPDVIFNTLDGDSNFSFYRQYHKAGISYKEIPIMAVSIAEGELQEMKEAVQGHYACWSYFQSLEMPENEHFVSNFKKKFDSSKVTSDPIAAAYSQLYLWKGTVETANSFNVSELCQNIVGQTFNSPGGEIRIEPNNHVMKNAHIGHISDGQFDIIWSSENKIKPQPWFGLDELDFQHSKLVIDLLSEASEGIQSKWILEQKTRALEKSSQAKSAFLSSMSHELRTPLNSIIGFSQLMETDKDNPPNPSQKENLNQIQTSSSHLLNLINDVLDLTKIEAGKIEVSLESLSVKELLKEIFPSMEPEAEKYDVTIIDKTADGEEVHIMADFTRVKQVLINLLSNAIKYNHPSGTATVSLEKRQGKMARISVEDTGKGISKEDFSKLFEPFNRLGAEGLDVEGTGIGLTITKKLVKIMGGEIGVNSEVGKGSTFYVDFQTGEKPVIGMKDTGTSSQTDSKKGASKKSVLYIEDNPANLKLVQKILNRRPNIRLLFSPEAKSGIELTLKHRPDLILMDINLPGMDGYEALNELQSLDETNKIPVIAISANAMKHDVERGKKAGFIDYLTKPIDITKFLDAVDSVLS